MTVAKVDDKLRLQSVDTWFDPLEMFRQIAPNGVGNKEVVDKRVYPETPGEVEDHNSASLAVRPAAEGESSVVSAGASTEVQPPPSDVATAVQPSAGEGVAATAGSLETVMTHQEMSNMTAADCPFLNRE